ncbi:hypothetical protein KHC28_24570 [Ancylobacter sonchi]|nr:hypothetical protein [Ancylobacter sonchi]MBS7536822.1 hypothetical protein [Ancylobacter sonchi]
MSDARLFWQLVVSGWCGEPRIDAIVVSRAELSPTLIGSDLESGTLSM